MFNYIKEPVATAKYMLNVLQAKNEELKELCSEQDAAITELAQLLTEDEANHEDLEAAVIELAEIVGGESDG